MDVGVVGGLVNSSPILVQTNEAAADDNRAQKFVVIDERGNERARLTVLEGAPGLMLAGGQAKTRAELALFEDKPTKSLLGEQGYFRASLTVFDDA